VSAGRVWASSARARKRSRTVGRCSSRACASISASIAWTFAGALTCSLPLRATGRSGPVLAVASRACQTRGKIIERRVLAASAATDQDRDRASVVSACGQRATDGQLDLCWAVLAGEHQHVDHLPGGLRRPVAFGDLSQRSSKADGQAPRSRSWERANEPASAPGLRASNSR